MSYDPQDWSVEQDSHGRLHLIYRQHHRAALVYRPSSGADWVLDIRGAGLPASAVQLLLSQAKANSDSSATVARCAERLECMAVYSRGVVRETMEEVAVQLRNTLPTCSTDEEPPQ